MINDTSIPIDKSLEDLDKIDELDHQFHHNKNNIGVNSLKNKFASNYQ